jgi:hypothetical protein
MLLATFDPSKAWEYLQYSNVSQPTEHLPLPYLNGDGKVVGYHRTLTMTTALFYVATNPRDAPTHAPHSLPHRH